MKRSALATHKSRMFWRDIEVARPLMNWLGNTGSARERVPVGKPSTSIRRSPGAVGPNSTSGKSRKKFAYIWRKILNRAFHCGVVGFWMLLSTISFGRQPDFSQDANRVSQLSRTLESSLGCVRPQIVRYGRLLDHPSKQPENTTMPTSYEVGKLFQLDRTTALLVASLREQGGHDFSVGNDAFIFRDLSDIIPEHAIPLNRLDPKYRLKSGNGTAVLAKYYVNGMFVPLGAKLANGRPHPAQGTGFFLTTAMAFLPDRSDTHPDNDIFIELLQVRWNGKTLRLHKDIIPQPPLGKYQDIGFNCIEDNGSALCPFTSDQGIVVTRFEYRSGSWSPTVYGRTFATVKFTSSWTVWPGSTKKRFSFGGELEPSLRRTDEGYLLHTRGTDSYGRVYRSQDGMNFTPVFNHPNQSVPQILSQGLDGSLYIATNSIPGLRNPLLLYSLRGLSFVDPIVIHDEKQIHQGRRKGETDKEVPFVDHAVGESIFLNGRWHHFLVYRVCDLTETDGSGAPPTPQTGVYFAELKYSSTTNPPFRF
jgi:hypothetical protein